MNTIASLTRSDPGLAEESVEDLADLFRASLQELHHLSRLEDEIDLCKRYLRIERHRLGDRLQVNWELGDLPMASKIPSLSIQPLLENAIYHGIEPMPEGGRINIRAKRNEGSYTLQIENPLAGQQATASQHEGNRFAQDNVRQRLLACFGDAAELDISPGQDSYLVTLTVPIEHESPGS